MMNAIKGFIANQDGFARNITMSYKGGPSFGTVTGGCSSMLASFFVLLYGFCAFWGLATNPKVIM